MFLSFSVDTAVHKTVYVVLIVKTVTKKINVYRYCWVKFSFWNIFVLFRHLRFKIKVVLIKLNLFLLRCQ